MAAVIAEGERELEVFKQRIQEEGSHTYNINARGADPEALEKRVVEAIQSAHRSGKQMSAALAESLPPQH
jgi:hypothetical protein